MLSMGLNFFVFVCLLFEKCNGYGIRFQIESESESHIQEFFKIA